jgi:ankyrin repeat protein
MKSLLNFRDHKGSTPLHIAAIWRNRVACETLLFLKANPLIEDGGGLKPIDYIDPGSALADLFRTWMARCTPPTLRPWDERDALLGKFAGLLKTQVETKGAAAKKKLGPAKKADPLDLEEVKSQSLEKLQSIRLNNTHDNIYQAAIKASRLDTAIFLRRAVDLGFPLIYQNGIGNTVLHNAVTLQDIKTFKLVIMEKVDESCLENPTIEDVKKNLKTGLAKCLNLKNDKGLTPLSCALETGGAELFRLLLNLYVHIE